jgi:hypothetical protein
VAIKIYETGLKKLGKEVDVDYVVHYLKFLININDTNSWFFFNLSVVETYDLIRCSRVVRKNHNQLHRS